MTPNRPGSSGSRRPGSLRSRWARPAGRPWPEFAASLRDGLRYLLTARTLLILTAGQMVVNLYLSVEKPIIYDARETLGLSSPLVGVVVAAGGLADALGAAPLAPGRVRCAWCCWPSPLRARRWPPYGWPLRLSPWPRRI